MSFQTVPFDLASVADPVIDLEVAGFKFFKRGGFTAAEMIAYEEYSNTYSEKSLELMVLANRIAKDLGIGYAEVTELLSSNAATESVLFDYVEDLLAIGMNRFSESKRRTEIVSMFIRSRCDREWSYERSLDLLYADIGIIYDFVMNEFRGWKVSEPLTDATVGKQLETSVLPSTVRSTGRKSTTTSKLAVSPTPDSTLQTSESS